MLSEKAVTFSYSRKKKKKKKKNQNQKTYSQWPLYSPHYFISKGLTVIC